MAYRAAVVQIAIETPESLNPDYAGHEPGAMIAETVRNVACTLDRKPVGQRARGETHPPALQQCPVDPSDRNVFRMVEMECRIAARGHKAAASQGKAAIANIMSISELRPAGADIVIIEKIRTPTRCIYHMAVPLDDQTMGCVDMIDHLGQEEIGIGSGRRDRWDRNYRDGRMIGMDRAVGKELASRDINLRQADFQRADRSSDIDRTDSAKGQLR